MELAPNGLPARLREGINHLEPTQVAEAEVIMDAAANEIDRLRAENAKLMAALERTARLIQI